MKVAYLKMAMPDGVPELFHDIFYAMDTGDGLSRKVYWTERDSISRGCLEPLSNDKINQIKEMLRGNPVEVLPPYSSLKIFEYDDKPLREVIEEIRSGKGSKHSETTRRFIRRVESL